MNEEKTKTKFARKEEVDVPAPLLAEAQIKIPPIYYWEDIFEDLPVLMTMAFKIYGRTFGLSYPVEEKDARNVVKMKMTRGKLFNVVKESLYVLLHHGEKILDSYGNIDPRLVNEQEALRFKYDPLWDKRVAVFNKLVRAVPITREEAVKLKLLNNKYA